MTITVITGGNKGLGYETARRLHELGHTVYIGSRDPDRGRAAADALGVRSIQLDVTDEDSVKRAATELESRHDHLDVLVNNAGVSGPRKEVTDLTGADAAMVFETNLIGTVRTTHAFLPLLQRSEAPVIVNVTSGLGSFALTQDGSRLEARVRMPLYQASKAGLTMLTTRYAEMLPGMRVNAADPGFTATDLNHNAGTQSITEGTDAIVAMATIGPDGPTGTVVNREGPIGW